ncbi:MAG: RNase adaptor protein RapZ, partial [Pseudobutyrivibrio sp.]|nr:RNase adaptor protein RapZ [Pseudobutyrivibrio sp.]
ADLVFDVRFLPNPYYDPELRPFTGNDAVIKSFVMGCEDAEIFLDKITGLIEFLIPNYIKEGKNQLVIAIGCTGGKHRSVCLANELHTALAGDDSYGLKIEHRDIGKDALRGK